MKSRTPNPDFPGIFDVSPDEIAMHSGDVYLIDVREATEFEGELGHIPQSRLVVLSTLPDQIESLPKDKPIVFICRSGVRSARAAAFAQANDFNEVYNLKGGMLLWNNLKLPVQKG